jgi:hypothetical protein
MTLTGSSVRAGRPCQPKVRNGTPSMSTNVSKDHRMTRTARQLLLPFDVVDGNQALSAGDHEPGPLPLPCGKGI